MSKEFAEYIRQFNAADKAWRKFRAAMNDLDRMIGVAKQSPAVLVQPAAGKWPTQEELRGLFQEAQKLSAPLQAEYDRLPEEIREHAPEPHTAVVRPAKP